jgi:hypothetical protein
VTIGAGPSSVGRLVSDLNRSSEIVPHQSAGISLRLLRPECEDLTIEHLLSLNSHFLGTQYDFAPFSGAGYNSNSFARGLIEAAGLIAPRLPASLFPDWNHPLPPSAFGVKQ